MKQRKIKEKQIEKYHLQYGLIGLIGRIINFVTVFPLHVVSTNKKKYDKFLH